MRWFLLELVLPWWVMPTVGNTLLNFHLNLLTAASHCKFWLLQCHRASPCKGELGKTETTHDIGFLFFNFVNGFWDLLFCQPALEYTGGITDSKELLWCPRVLCNAAKIQKGMVCCMDLALKSGWTMNTLRGELTDDKHGIQSLSQIRPWMDQSSFSQNHCLFYWPTNCYY